MTQTDGGLVNPAGTPCLALHRPGPPAPGDHTHKAIGEQAVTQDAAGDTEGPAMGGICCAEPLGPSPRPRVSTDLLPHRPF